MKARFIIVKVMVFVLALGMFAGCAQVQQKLDSDVNDALALSLPDLDAAHNLAVSANDPNPAHDKCWTGLADAIRAQIAAEPPADQASVQPIGLASAAQAFLLDDVKPLKVNLPPLPYDVKGACYSTIGELRVKATVDTIRMSAAITATVHKVIH